MEIKRDDKSGYEENGKLSSINIKICHRIIVIKKNTRAGSAEEGRRKKDQ